MTHIAAAVGFYGKLPCRGDFVTRRVPQSFLDAWDDWLQRCVSESRQALQEQWLDVYLTSPIWRFVLSEGVCGSGAYAGVVVPSVDRVGRYFPLTIVAQWNVDECPLDAACGSQQWFEAAEALAMEAPETSDLDAFDARVARLAELIDSAGVAESSYLHSLIRHAEFPHGTSQWHVPLATVHSLQRAANVLAFRELERTLRPISLWWTDGSDRVDAAWLCTRGLPAPQSFAAMMSGEWAATGWRSLDKTRASGAPPSHEPSPASARGIDTELALISGEPQEFTVTQPPRLTAHHEPLSRKWDAEPQNVFFVTRPELGLWGVCASGAGDAKHATAQAFADVLENVPAAATLTALVEDVRRSLEGARRQLVRSAGSGAPDPYVVAQVLVFLARGDECSLVCCGEVQAIRCRSSSVQSIIGVADFTDDALGMPRRDGSGSLMDIVTGRVEPSSIVRYESLRAGDTWLLAATPLFDEPQIPTLEIALANGIVETGVALTAVRAASSVEQTRWTGPLPVLLLAAQRAALEA